MRPVLLAAALLLAAGCNTAGPLVDTAPVTTDGLVLTADARAYGRGDTARLTLTNGSAATATTGVLECALVERWTGAAWTPSASGNDRACIQIARILAPGDAMTGEVPLDLPAGSYRLTQPVSLDGSGESVAVSTASFAVE